MAQLGQGGSSLAGRGVPNARSSVWMRPQEFTSSGGLESRPGATRKQPFSEVPRQAPITSYYQQFGRGGLPPQGAPEADRLQPDVYAAYRDMRADGMPQANHGASGPAGGLASAWLPGQGGPSEPTPYSAVVGVSLLGIKSRS